jgi:toxin ParE1/3/4
LLIGQIEDLQSIRDFIAIHSSEQKANQFVDEVFNKISLIESGFKKIGAIEPFAKNRDGQYRYLICKNYKIIYRILPEKVEITTIFDVRQDPNKLKI